VRMLAKKHTWRPIFAFDTVCWHRPAEFCLTKMVQRINVTNLFGIPKRPLVFSCLTHHAKAEKTRFI